MNPTATPRRHPVMAWRVTPSGSVKHTLSCGHTVKRKGYREALPCRVCERKEARG